MTSTIVRFSVGERRVEVLVPPLTTLQTVLRSHLGLTATKDGCRQGGCGSCTVLVDGDPVPSCLVPVEDVAGRRVTTLETITPVDGLHPIQAAFVEERGFQCGYCTPGMVMLAAALLEREPTPDEATIREALAGNLCRCTGYRPIVAAIGRAAAIARATDASAAPAPGGGPEA